MSDLLKPLLPRSNLLFNPVPQDSFGLVSGM